MNRGEIWWADLDEPRASEPGYRHPVIIIQDDAFNASQINTIIAVMITSNLSMARMPGNILLEKAESGLPKDSVANVSQIVTVDKSYLKERIGVLRPAILRKLNASLMTVLGLQF